MITLGIETSCDDTSIALVEDGCKVICSRLASQNDIHKRFGGVVPEVASRKHLEAILPLLNEVMQKAQLKFSSINQIAVTVGPGLLGPLITGLSTAKALAWQLGVSLVPVNHIEAHLTAGFLNEGKLPEYPFVGLIVSGGHSVLVIARGPRDYEILGQTVDDAPGELYDKAARFLSLGYPGGPVIQKTGSEADENRYPLPRPMLKKGYMFSFSGLKTAVIRTVEKEKEAIDIPGLCASLQAAVAEVLVAKTELAVIKNRIKTIVMAGGVAANQPLRERMHQLSDKLGARLYVPQIHLCTDNAAMIAAHGFHTAHLTNHDSMKVNASANLQMGDGFFDR